MKPAAFAELPTLGASALFLAAPSRCCSAWRGGRWSWGASERNDHARSCLLAVKPGAFGLQLPIFFSVRHQMLLRFDAGGDGDAGGTAPLRPADVDGRGAVY